MGCARAAVLLCSCLSLPSTAFAGQASSAVDATARPAFERLRQEEDWSMLCDSQGPAELLDTLKCIRLGEDGATLSLGGEVRQRYEYTSNPQWGEAIIDADGAILQRYVLHADLRVGERVRLFTQLSSALAFDRVGGPSPVDENRLDLQQAFVELTQPFSAGTAQLRLGRQELRFGSARLVDVREGPNVRRTFDGARGALRSGGGWRLDLVAVRPVRALRGIFDDRTDRTQALWGAYFTASQQRLPTGFDFYYLGYSDEEGRFEQGLARETRHTIGSRVFGERAGFDWNWELIHQWGRFGTSRIAAWSVASDTGYTWQGAPLAPRLGLSANIASGDRDPEDGKLGTFNPLFPRGNYFSELALLGPRNFYNLHPSIDLRPAERLSVTAGTNFFWRLQQEDGVYGPGGQLLRTSSGSDVRYVGTEFSLNATYRADARTTLSAIYSRFWPGRFIEDTGSAQAIDYLELTWKWQF